MRLSLVTVPYRYDERGVGLGAGPGALLKAGLPAGLAAAGHAVEAPTEARLDPEEREPGRTALNIGRLGAHTATLVADARHRGVGALVLAGDDTASVGVVAGIQAADGPGTAIGLVWLDAHGDFNTPETSFSGILAGMPVAILAGLAGPLWRGAAGMAVPIPTDRMLLAGVRQLDEKEETLLRSTDVRLVRTDDVTDGKTLPAAVARLAATCSHLYLHVDLDILDPHLVPSASTPAERGLEVDQAAAAMRTVLESGKVAAVCVAGLNPGAGARGERSIRSTLALLQQALPAWRAAPPSSG
jgi:arginase